MGKLSLLLGERKVKLLQIFHFNQFSKPFSPNAALEISSSGPAADDQGEMMGRYELVFGEEQDGSPVYRQAHSGEIPSNYDNLLYR